MIILSTSTSYNFQLLLMQTVILLQEPQITETWIGDLWMGKVAIKHPKKKLFLGPMKKKTKINLRKMLQQNNSREDSPKAKKVSMKEAIQKMKVVPMETLGMVPTVHSLDIHQDHHNKHTIAELLARTFHDQWDKI